MSASSPGSEEPLPPGEMNEGRVGFDATLDELRDDLLAYQRWQLGDREAAADLMQETLTRALKYRDAAVIQDRRGMLFRVWTAVGDRY